MPMKNLCELLGYPEGLGNHNVAGNGEREGSRISRMGQSAAKLRRPGEGSTTIPRGSRAQAGSKRRGAVKAMIWSGLCGNIQRAVGSGQLVTQRARTLVPSLAVSDCRPIRKRMVQNPVNCWEPKAKARAISSQAAQEWAEGSETTSYRPDRTMKAHESGAPTEGEEIVRHSGETRRAGIKSPAITDEERNCRISPVRAHGSCLNPVNCWNPKADTMAISSQAIEESVEGSETTAYDPDRIMKRHERGAPIEGDDIVRYPRKLGAWDKEPKDKS